MINPKSTHANFSVNDIEEAKKFYVDKLGLRLDKQHEGGLVLKSNSGSLINIYYRENRAPWDATVLGVEVDDVESAVDALQSDGIAVENLPGTDDKGIAHDPNRGDAAWLKDPAGNWVCISTGV